MLNKIRCVYIIKEIFKNIEPVVFLNIIRYNKKIQKKLETTKGNYHYYDLVIKIELIPKNIDTRNTFINIKENEKDFYQIYFDKKKVKKNYFTNKEKISKIKIVINNEIKSLKGLFSGCSCIKEINFIKFKKKDITDMSQMFYNCENLIKINFNEFNTSNVITMKNMFRGCLSLKKIELFKFDTSNVNDMSYMFYQCESLKRMDLSKLNTINVDNINGLFSECISLKFIDITTFRTRLLLQPESFIPDVKGLIYKHKSIKGIITCYK